MQKCALLKKNGFDRSFISNLSAVGNNWPSRLQKHQTLPILTKVDFYAFFKISLFSIFLKSISCSCLNLCMHFILSEQDSPSKIKLESSILW